MSDFSCIEKIYKIVINQNHHNVIPFVFKTEDEFKNAGAELSFSFRGTSDNTFLNFSNVSNPNNDIETQNTTYVQSNNDANFSPTFFLDLITNTPSQNVSVSTNINNKDKHMAKYTFVIPKFTWSKYDYDKGTSTITGSAWIGSESSLCKVDYSNEKATIVSTFAFDSDLQNIYFDTTSNLVFISTYDHLYKYTFDHYINTNNDYTLLMNKEKYLFNNDREKMTLYNDDTIFGPAPYDNKINLRNSNLQLIDEFDGFDSPQKIIKSSFHNFYIVSGTNVLWKYDASTSSKSSIYFIEDYTISDFAVNKDGKVCLLLTNDSNSILRILDSNFFKILYENKITNGNFKWCNVCNDQFYAIAELDGGTAQYVLGHYIYNITKGTMSITNTNNTIQKNEESSSDEPATSKIEVTYPNGGEKIQFDDEVNILWKSTESITDNVKIELFNDEELVNIIASVAPNSGSFKWAVPSTLDIASTYKIKISLLTANNNPDDSGESDADFTITDYASSSGIAVSEYNKIVGIGFDDKNEQIVIATSDGFLGLFDLSSKTLYGLFNLGIDSINSIGVRNERVKTLSSVSKIRIFVGSALNLNDMWDSGEIETDLSSIFYTGKALLSGETYYINIQVYSEAFGFSDIQTKKIIMP